MGCKSNTKETNMQRGRSHERDNHTTESSHQINETVNTNVLQNTSQGSSSGSQEPSTLGPVPTTPQTVPPSPTRAAHLNHNHRPHSAHVHRTIGRILRNLGDGYCYSCGIALRQMGDELSGEYEVRRAFSTGDIPGSLKNT